MVKYSEAVGELITRLQKQPKIIPVTHQEAPFISCRACDCEADEHEQYVYCGLIEGFLCRICCCYDLYNNYQLVNRLLNKEVFTADEEVRLVCDRYCPVNWGDKSARQGD